MTTLYNINIGGDNKVTTLIRSGLRVPYDLNTKLIKIAKEKGISKNALILQILWNYIQTENKE